MVSGSPGCQAGNFDIHTDSPQANRQLAAIVAGDAELARALASRHVRATLASA